MDSTARTCSPFWTSSRLSRGRMRAAASKSACRPCTAVKRISVAGKLSWWTPSLTNASPNYNRRRKDEPMSAVAEDKKLIVGGSFLIEERTPEEVFTPEDFTEEHRMIADTARQFMDNEVRPRIPELEKK